MKICKKMSNLEIAKLLDAVASSYQLKDEKIYRFQIIAYERAADAVEHASSELKDLWDEGKLEEVPGIGKSIAEHLGEIFKTGKSKHFKDLMKGLPSQIFDLTQVSGIGVKTAKKLVDNLRISKKSPLKDLECLAKKGEVAKLEGMGKDSEKDILRAIKEVKKRSNRLILPYAQKIADEIIEWVKNEDSVVKINTLGSLRRKASTIGDIDISVASNNTEAVIEHFTSYPKAKRTIEKGKRSASIVVPPDVQIDIKAQKPDTYGSLLQHFTGSKHHNIALREYALKKNLSLSEYGIRKVDGKRKSLKTQKELKARNIKKRALKKFKDEDSFYKYLGLSWIPPELRENNGEIKAALNQAQGNKTGLPKLVELKDVKGDLQIHSIFDIETSHDLGLSSIEDIVDKANELNYEYVALTEHNPSHSKHNKEQIIDLLKRKKENVEQINDTYVKRMKGSVKFVFNSLEIDILPNGKLPVPEEGLKLLDFALVSIHSSFRLSKNRITKRVLSALSENNVKIFAHPTGRKLQEREGVELDWEEIFEFCKNNNKWIEINAEPMRLDLPDFLVKEAIKSGVLLTLGTDAHHVDHMDNMTYGVSVARRGWAEKKNIINTLSYEDFRKLL
ncbi:helix-hairpin-helix domain-containing protein [Patescibacteria group bacterium]